MPRRGQPTAAKLALQSLAASSQPNLRLPIEVIDHILEIHVFEDCQPTPRVEKLLPSPQPFKFTPIPLSVLLSCKLFKQLVSPYIYQQITLDGKKAYFKFLNNVHPDNYQYVKKLTLYNLDLSAKTSVEEEERSIVCMEERIRDYKKIMETKAGKAFKYEMPKDVEFEMVYETRKRCRSHVTQCYVSRLCKLFSVRPFKIHPVYFRMAFPFDPAGFCLQEVHLSDVLLAPRMDEASAELFYCENNIETIVYTIQQPGRESEDWTRYRDQRSVTDQIDNVVRLIQMEMVTDKIIVKAGSAPHAFCCTTDDARKKVRHPKIVLQCCPTECNVKKEGDVGLLNHLFRSTGDLDTLCQEYEDGLESA